MVDSHSLGVFTLTLYQRIYWVGPILGSLLAAGFYWFIKACEYETANPGQDFDDLEANVYNPELELRRPSISQGDPALRVLSSMSDDQTHTAFPAPNEDIASDSYGNTHASTTHT